MSTLGCACALLLGGRGAWVRCPFLLGISRCWLARGLGIFGAVAAVTAAAIVVSVPVAAIPAIAIAAPDGHVAAQFNGCCFDGRVGFEAGDDDLVDVAFD